MKVNRYATKDVNFYAVDCEWCSGCESASEKQSPQDLHESLKLHCTPYRGRAIPFFIHTPSPLLRTLEI